MSNDSKPAQHKFQHCITPQGRQNRMNLAKEFVPDMMRKVESVKKLRSSEI